MTNTAKRFLGLVVLQRAAELVAEQGQRSYPAPHCGRPGEVGGSLPREECGMDEGDAKEEAKRETQQTAKGQYPKGSDNTTQKVGDWLVDDIYEHPREQENLAALGWRGTERYAPVGGPLLVVQNQIISEIAEEIGVSKYKVRELMEAWQQTSAGRNLSILHLQRLAAEEFSLETRPSILERILKIENGLLKADEGGELSFADRGLSETEQRSILRAMYNNTQEELKKAGFKQKDTIRLWRGSYIHAGQHKRPEGAIGVFGNPLSSWSIGEDIANDFARALPPVAAVPGDIMGAVFEMDVPIGAILATPRTGMGELWTGEFVVLVDKVGHQAKLAKVYPRQKRSAGGIVGKGDGVFEVDIDWCEENEEWLRPPKKRGGPGSGHHGHKGRPGEVGGSLPGSGSEQPPALSKLRGKAPEGEDTTTELLNEWLVEDLSDQLQESQQEAASLCEDLWEWGEVAPADMRAAKNEIVEALVARTGFSHGDVNAFVKQWANTSNNYDMRSLAIQRAAAELFGVPLSEFTRSRIAEMPRRLEKEIKRLVETSTILDEATKKWVKGTPGDWHKWVLENYPKFSPLLPDDMQRSLLQAMYDNTQNRLASRGFKSSETVRLWRGVRLPKADTAGWEWGDVRSIAGNTLESWTVSESKAGRFAVSAGPRQTGVVYGMDVPVEWVVGSARTGFGCLEEGEFVIFGSIPSEAEVVRLFEG